MSAMAAQAEELGTMVDIEKADVERGGLDFAPGGGVVLDSDLNSDSFPKDPVSICVIFSPSGSTQSQN